MLVLGQQSSRDSVSLQASSWNWWLRFHGPKQVTWPSHQEEGIEGVGVLWQGQHVGYTAFLEKRGEQIIGDNVTPPPPPKGENDTALCLSGHFTHGKGASQASPLDLGQ